MSVAGLLKIPSLELAQCCFPHILLVEASHRQQGAEKRLSQCLNKKGLVGDHFKLGKGTLHKQNGGEGMEGGRETCVRVLGIAGVLLQVCPKRLLCHLHWHRGEVGFA